MALDKCWFLRAAKRNDSRKKKWQAGFLSNGAEPVYDPWL
jgi:hypothetical protein